MNRRSFLTIAGLSAAGLIVPELILPKRSFFLPPAGGWEQPSLAELWLNYARDIVPIGVELRTALTDTKTPGVWEGTIPNIMFPAPEPWAVVLEVGRNMDAATEWRMRRALLQKPSYSWPSATIADLKPWDRS